MDRLNYHHLYLFYVIAMQGSIKAASEKVHLTQATLSDQLKSLEEYFGTKLFDRVGRQLILNPSGKTALEYAQNIFSLGNELKLTLKGEAEGPKKVFNFGLTHYMSNFLVYDRFLPLFKDKDMATVFHEGERGHLLADLELGDLDLVVTTSKVGLTSNMVARKIGQNKIYAVAHKSLVGEAKFKFPSVLTDLPYFQYSKSSELFFDIEVYFRTHGISPNIIGEANDFDLFELVTKKGLAFTIIPDATLRKLKKNEDIVTLGEVRDLESNVWAVMRKEAPEVLRKFVEKLSRSKK